MTSLDLRGDTNTAIVSLGNVYSEKFTKASNFPYTTITRNIAVSHPTNATLAFDQSPFRFDTFGLLLDNVKLYSTDQKVKDTNHIPVATNDTAIIKEDTSVNIKVLANDTDSDKDTLHVMQIAKLPLHGTAYINGDDTITYTPSSRFFGKDGFGYTISDGRRGTAIATVTVSVNHVNHIPIAFNSTSAITTKEVQ